MEIYKITKGNFALENTRDIRPHENNLRFHIKIEEKYYEYAIDTINKKTINIRCVICKSKFKKKCYADRLQNSKNVRTKNVEKLL